MKVTVNRNPMQIWECKIGQTPACNVPPCADGPMREAIRRAYREITGQEPLFIFSGWNAELNEVQKKCVSDEEPEEEGDGDEEDEEEEEVET
jgi:hypothetical protein